MVECLCTLSHSTRFLDDCTDPEEHYDQLRSVADLFATEKTLESTFLRKSVTLPKLFESGFDHEDLLSEWDEALPELCRLSKSLTRIPVSSTSSETRELKKRKRALNQADIYSSFLGRFSRFRRVCVVVQIMIVLAVNSSLVERSFSWLKYIKNDKRNRLDDEQLNRLLLLAMNLPEKLDDIDISKIVSGM